MKLLNDHDHRREQLGTAPGTSGLREGEVSRHDIEQAERERRLAGYAADIDREGVIRWEDPT